MLLKPCSMHILLDVFFFLQAEDGIRDATVTGVQTCALPISKELDKLTFPGTQGGPLVNTIAAKAVCLKEATEQSFKDYQKQVVANTKAMAAAVRSEERRVGKESRSRRAQSSDKKEGESTVSP